jgi:uncharacterized protein involved in exopolysaccharide biosynthesis
MFEENLKRHTSEAAQSTSLRDLLAIGFRQRKLIITIFLGIFSAAVLIALLLPKQYESQMKILVRHERAESVVSPVRDAPVQLQTEVSEEELQSEAELLKSRDLLTKVVMVCNLDKLGGNSLFARIWNKFLVQAKSEDPRTIRKFRRPFWPWRRTCRSSPSN